jgi:hypothetical protein
LIIGKSLGVLSLESKSTIWLKITIIFIPKMCCENPDHLAKIVFVVVDIFLYLFGITTSFTKTKTKKE